MQDHWAAKSAKDDEHPAVVQAKRWHLALHLALLALGVAAGYVAFQLTDDRTPLAFFLSLYEDEYRHWDVLVCGLYMAVFGWLGGEAGSAVWLILCRYPLGVSAEHARAALDSSVVLSFLARPLHARLYVR